MTDTIDKLLYSFLKVLVLFAGGYIVFYPPYTFIGTASSAIMMVAALVSIYAIWTDKPDIEFVSLWFVICGVAAYAGFVWIAQDTFLRSLVAAMLLVMLIARGRLLWRMAKQHYALERLLKEDGRH